MTPNRELEIPFAEFPGFHLRVAANALTSKLNNLLEPYALRLTEISILVTIKSNEGCTAAAICQALDIARPNMTPIIGKLERAGLIERRALDGRSSGLHPTSAGTTVAVAWMKDVAAYEQSLEKALGGEAEAFIKKLTAIRNASR